jgi:nitrite reductase (NADH) large subunit
MNKLVVVGNGMAGVGCVEQILKHAAKFAITIFGDETHVNYNRILLSSVLAGEKASADISLNSPRICNASRLSRHAWKAA